MIPGPEMAEAETTGWNPKIIINGGESAMTLGKSEIQRSAVMGFEWSDQIRIRVRGLENNRLISSQGIKKVNSSSILMQCNHSPSPKKSPECSCGRLGHDFPQDLEPRVQ
jgi:hypothetical protein